MMISEIGGQSPEGYDGVLAHVGEALRRAPGFIMHMAHPAEAGWRIVEVWQSREDATRFFATHIAPNLPEGIRPKLSFQPLHSLVQRDVANDSVVTGLIRRSEEAHAALMRGDVGRYRDLIELADDFTLMSPFGGTSRGVDITAERWEAMGRFFRNGVFEQEIVCAYGSADIVVLALIERRTVEVGGLPAQCWPLRVTLVYRREGPDWRLAHRHADPLALGITVEKAASLARGEAA